VFDEPHSKPADRRYRACWLDPGSRERFRTFTREADAERHLAAVEVAKLSGLYVRDPNPVTMDVRASVGNDGSPSADHGNASCFPDQ
jgi:hypothetical protein